MRCRHECTFACRVTAKSAEELPDYEPMNTSYVPDVADASGSSSSANAPLRQPSATSIRSMPSSISHYSPVNVSVEGNEVLHKGWVWKLDNKDKPAKRDKDKRWFELRKHTLRYFKRQSNEGQYHHCSLHCVRLRLCSSCIFLKVAQHGPHCTIHS